METETKQPTPAVETPAKSRFMQTSKDLQHGILVYSTALPDGTKCRIRINGRRVRGVVNSGHVWFVAPAPLTEFCQISGPSLA